MSDHTGIEWTDATWNPVVGCTKVSQGCKHCYAKQLHDQRHRAHLAGKPVAAQYAQPFERVQLMPQRLPHPLSWRKPRRIFVNSVSDLFHEDVPVDFIAQVWAVMALAPQHTFQILTKRPLRMHEVLRRPDFYHLVLREAGEIRRTRPALTAVPVSNPTHADGAFYPHVWLGVSVENQEAADKRIPWLLETPAAVRFLSCEPLLGPVNLEPYLWRQMSIDEIPGWALNDGFMAGIARRKLLHWVITGGESGEGARPMHPGWVRTIRDQCAAAGVAFLFKQWGNWKPISEMASAEHDALYLPAPEHDPEAARACRVATRALQFDGGEGYHVVGPHPGYLTFEVGKKKSGRLLDGVLHDEFPGRAA